MTQYFKRFGIFLLVIFIFIVSMAFAWFFVNPKYNDWPSLFISSLGSIATIIAIPVAYAIFKSYSATADIQKRQFQIAEEAFTFLISQKMDYSFPNAYVLLYLTSDRVKVFNEFNGKSDFDTSQKVYVNSLFFEFIIELGNKFNQLYFPKSIKGDLLSHLPNAMRIEDLPEGCPLLEVREQAGLTKKEQHYGVPFMLPENDLSVKDLISNLIYIKNQLETYLNNHLDPKYHIDS